MVKMKNHLAWQLYIYVHCESFLFFQYCVKIREKSGDRSADKNTFVCQNTKDIKCVTHDQMYD